MSLLQSALVNLISSKCYDKYFLDHDFMDVDCFKIFLSKALGYSIILGSLLVKVPQIVKILTNKSAEGINIFGVLLEITAITINLSYSFVSGFPFSAWGDCSFLAIQTAIIASLVLYHTGPIVRVILFLVAYVAASVLLMGGTTPLHVLWSLQSFNIPILIAGKLSQAVTNYRSGSTGQLSAVTCFMLFFGSMARIFTSVQETGDAMLIFTYCVSTVSNGVIVAQLLWYWNAADGKKRPTSVKAKAKAAKAKAKKAD